MADILIGLHAVLGELGIAAFIWVFVELINVNDKSINRAILAAQIGTILFVLSWFVGGFYYTQEYGTLVKPIIKAGPSPWGHNLIMEAKEHIFIFLPFVSLITASLLRRKKKEILKSKEVRRGALILAVTVIILGALMAGMGYLISSSARDALEVLAK